MTKEQYLELINEVIEKGPYKDSWESLSGHPIPKWFTAGKLGIFIHFGVYSVPGYGSEWYSRCMYDPVCGEYEHHLKTYGPHKDFGYKDFIPMFKAEKFNAGEWADLFQKAGVKYVMPVAEHHDGFAMYDTEFNRWNAAKMGPCKDIVGELKTACEERDMTFCASTHRAEHYFFMNMGRTIDSDVNDPAYADFYGPAVYCPEFHSHEMHKYTANVYEKGADKEWLEDWLVRTCELADKYQPQIVYFDWWIHNHSYKPYLKKFAAYYYNRAAEWGKEVTINYKHEAYAPTTAVFDVERGALGGISPLPWQTDTAIAKNSWGYTQGNEFKSSRQIIGDLVDIVSKNGNLLLNIGPKPDGTITDEETKVLEDLGDWLSVNGEGIYETTFWKWFKEGEVNIKEGYFTDNDEKAFTEKDFRFTYKNSYLYAFQMCPDGEAAKINTLSKRSGHDFLIDDVTLLGSNAPTEYERTEDALVVKVNGDVNTDLPICFKIKIG